MTGLFLASVAYCVVGCNTGSPDLQALHLLKCDTETGEARIVQSVKGVQGTTYFQFDRARKNLYTAIAEKGRGVIVRFALEGAHIGDLTKIADLPCEAPCHIALSPDERRIAFASYLSATCGTVGIDGKGLVTYVFPDDAMGSRADRQKKAYAHQTFFLPNPACSANQTLEQSNNQTILGVVDLGCDRIRFFAPETMTPLSGCALAFDSGDGPRHAQLSKDGKFLFVVNELGSTVSSFAFTAPSIQPIQQIKQSNNQTIKQFSFTPLGKWSMLPDGCSLKPTETKAAAIKLTADGRILMASNRGHDSIAFYEVRDDGRLALKNVAKLTGKFPRDFELVPGERFMVVGHKMSNEVQVYAFDRTACTLTPVGKPIAVWRPLCFKFL